MSKPRRPFAARPRQPIGNRPNDLGDPHVERVLAITIAVAGELSALYERLDTLARVAAEKQTFSMADLEAYEPTPAVAAERDAWRIAYLKRVLRVVHEAGSQSDAALDYPAFVKEVS